MQAGGLVMADRTRDTEPTGGWYCRDCGWVTRTPPEGFVTCQRCGRIGLRGFDAGDVIPDPRTLPVCPRCQGEGHKHQDGSWCPMCDGTGVLQEIPAQEPNDD